MRLVRSINLNKLNKFKLKRDETKKNSVDNPFLYWR